MIEMKPEDLEKLITPPGLMATKRSHTSPRRPVVFLSTSFRKWPQVSEQARLIKEVFGERFEMTGGWGISGGRQLHKILSEIRKSDVVLIEATYLAPNILLEMGMAYALAHDHKKRVFLLFNLEAPNRTIAALPEYVRSLDIVSYTFDVARLQEVRDKVYEKLQTDPEPEELLAVNIRGNTLRPRSDVAGVYIYYPHERAVWRTIIDDVRDKLENANLRLYTWVGAPSGSTRLEEVIYNVSRSSRELSTSCFADTSNDSSVDLVGAFALGAATALRRGAECLVEEGANHLADMSLWTELTFLWRSKEQLVTHILESSCSKKSKRKRR